MSEDGLAVCGDDLKLALARKIVSCEEEDETVEDVLTQTRDAEATVQEYLLDDGWKLVEVELEAVEVNGNHHAEGIGPTVELVLCNSHANSLPLTGYGRTGMATRRFR